MIISAVNNAVGLHTAAWLGGSTSLISHLIEFFKKVR